MSYFLCFFFLFFANPAGDRSGSGGNQPSGGSSETGSQTCEQAERDDSDEQGAGDGEKGIGHDCRTNSGQEGTAGPGQSVSHLVRSHTVVGLLGVPRWVYLHKFPSFRENPTSGKWFLPFALISVGDVCFRRELLQVIAPVFCPVDCLRGGRFRFVTMVSEITKKKHTFLSCQSQLAVW